MEYIWCVGVEECSRCTQCDMNREASRAYAVTEETGKLTGLCCLQEAC